MFYGSIIFRFFGVLLRWVVMNCWVLLSRKGESVSFKDVWKGKLDNDFASGASYEMSDILIGVFFILIVCALLIFFRV